MPKVLDECVKKVKPKLGESSAYAVCTKSLQKSGKMKKSKKKGGSNG